MRVEFKGQALDEVSGFLITAADADLIGAEPEPGPEVVPDGRPVIGG